VKKKTPLRKQYLKEAVKQQKFLKYCKTQTGKKKKTFHMRIGSDDCTER